MHYQEANFQGLSYLVRYPEGFDPTRPCPTLLFLHGAGTRGRDMQLLRNNPFFQEIEKLGDFPFLVVAPLCHESTWFEVWERLMALARNTAGLPFVDSSRLYLMGASMGGYGTWQLAMSLPEYFAAIVPICGGGMFWNALRLVNVPVWAFHGALDPVIPVAESQKMVDAVNTAGGSAKLTIYPKNEHNAWSDTYSNPEVFRWLLSHRNENTTDIKDPYHNITQHG